MHTHAATRIRYTASLDGPPSVDMHPARASENRHWPLDHPTLRATATDHANRAAARPTLWPDGWGLRLTPAEGRALADALDHAARLRDDEARDTPRTKPEPQPAPTDDMDAGWDTTAWFLLTRDNRRHRWTLLDAFRRREDAEDAANQERAAFGQACTVTLTPHELSDRYNAADRTWTLPDGTIIDQLPPDYAEAPGPPFDGLYDRPPYLPGESHAFASERHQSR